jgi:hypothetical protein
MTVIIVGYCVWPVVTDAPAYRFLVRLYVDQYFLKGAVPTPELRDAVMRSVEREVSRRQPGARAEDRLVVGHALTTAQGGEWPRRSRSCEESVRC